MKGIVVHPEWTGGWIRLNHTKSRKQSWENTSRTVIEVGQESKLPHRVKSQSIDDKSQ
jgi:hypothetical protein